jgi:hypothetical protein
MEMKIQGARRKGTWGLAGDPAGERRKWTWDLEGRKE